MNFFRFIADMLHLAAILILIFRIKKNRNCIGKTLPPYIPRPLLQDLTNFPGDILLEIYGPFHVLYLSVQHINEDLFHLRHSIHYLFDESGEALLLSKILSPFTL